jgi:pentatricopeptide repeat protein
MAMDCFGQQDKIKEMLELFQQMRTVDNIAPSQITYNNLMKHCARVEDVASLKKLCADSLSYNIPLGECDFIWSDKYFRC